MERAQNYSPPTSFPSLSISYPPCLFSTPGHLPTQQAKIVRTWKGVASALYTATVQSAAENAALNAENTALKSRKRDLEAQGHDLQCIVVAAVAERDQLALKHKAVKCRNRELEVQVHDLQCIVVAAAAERDQLALKLQKVGAGTVGQNIGSFNDNENGRGGDCMKDYASPSAARRGTSLATPLSASTPCALSLIHI